MEGNSNKLAGFVEPLAERLRDLVNVGLRVLVGNGDDEVVDRDVLLGRAGDRDLEVILEELRRDSAVLPYLLSGRRGSLVDSVLFLKHNP